MGKKKSKAKSSKPEIKQDNAQTSSHGLSESLFAKSAQSTQMMLKLCRLCECIDGPFLNIFGDEQPIAKKIEVVLPFSITENDDLPNSICFRCSAKVEEFHEFVQKCVKSQDNLQKTIGKKAEPPKTRIRQVWEEKLNKSNISNDDICNAVIEQAMKGIANLPIPDVAIDVDDEPLQIPKPKLVPKTKAKPRTELERLLEPFNKSPENNNSELKTRSRLSETEKPKEVEVKKPKVETRKPKDIKPVQTTTVIPEPKPILKNKTPKQIVPSTDEDSDDVEVTELQPQETKSNEKPFNINDYISTIKVNGVGVLFQCKLCNRNFVKQDDVQKHGCAKNGAPKETPSVSTNPPKPTPSSVKYINHPTKQVEKPVEIQKPKPKIGPASRVKKITLDEPVIGMKVVPRPPTPPFIPEINVMSLPGTTLQSRFKLVPGPNNTFTLIDEQKTQSTKRPSDVVHEEPPKKIGPKSKTVQQPYPVGLIQAPLTPATFTTPAMKKQSYQVVQTGNPSKLLISAKPQEPKLKSKKKQDTSEPFPIHLEDVSRPRDDLFTFINVDPLLQPSYVLPSNNIIQEAQISTSTSAKSEDGYKCNMCSETFSREKKLIAHIQAHYNKLDEEETSSRSRKRSKK